MDLTGALSLIEEETGLSSKEILKMSEITDWRIETFFESRNEDEKILKVSIEEIVDSAGVTGNRIEEVFKNPFIKEELRNRKDFSEIIRHNDSPAVPISALLILALEEKDIKENYMKLFKEFQSAYLSFICKSVKTST
ncbi:MAG: hypothetical protein ABEI53_02535 [Candidatus Magasanikbacteria bacterium]